MSIDDATLRQIAAANPKVSTWLSANAGSGKTRVLTDRVARLLLGGTSPQNILCLTYTKAAANEMQNRLFDRLGNWSMMDEAALRTELEQLGVPHLSDSRDLAHARTLFARAIDTPGGLRIQTIHSFCASLLRRFPLEAGVSPLFREMEERAVKQLRQDVVESIAEHDLSGCMAEVAKHYSGEDFSALTNGAIRYRERLLNGQSKADIWASFGLAEGFDDADLLALAFVGDDVSLIEELLLLLSDSDKSTDQNAAKKLAAIDFADPATSCLPQLFSVFLYGSAAKTAEPFSAKIDGFPTKGVREQNPDITQRLNEMMLRIQQCREPYLQLNAARRTWTFHRFATEFLPLYEAQKSARGWLDFDDLIQRARALLSDPAVAQWVLFRLDGGLDHILVDEAQDTSPDQWKVIELLTQEFAAGIGTRPDAARTIFVVGDLKQSIFSFQGADPKAFDGMRQHFAASLAASQQNLSELSLDHSFRSSPAILKLVDSVFQRSDNSDSLGHQAFHKDMHGRVDLWDIVEKTEAPGEKEWFDPSVNLATENHLVELAQKIANQIKTMVHTETIQDQNGGFRPIRFDDFLILVQSRSPLFHHIIRACKARDLPMAGADRLKIGGEIAVKDLQALLAFLAMPMDSLSLAVALRSPLFGLDEAGLFDLAQGRKEKDLWSVLAQRGEEFHEIFPPLNQLRNQVDFLSPYELLERILTRHNGRQKLLARLGPEAEDGIDALLAQAVAYETTEIPSLTGFLVWLGTEGVEIKRQSDAAGGRIRVMTTHGAKGLESPIVILPDTGDRRAPRQDEIITPDSDNLMWRMRADLQPDVMKAALADEMAAHHEERSRLLYVALTRAEKWLIICAAGVAKDDGTSWYRSVLDGMRAADATEFASPTGPGLRLEHGEWQSATDKAPQPSADAEKMLPAWVDGRAPAPVKQAPTLSPSDLGGDKSLPGNGPHQQPVGSAARGRHLHRLLEHLPRFAEAEWQNLSEQLLDDPESTLEDSERRKIFAKAAALIKNPEFAHIFASDTLAEVDVSANIAGLNHSRIRGVIDRLVISPDSILIVDFKSNQVVPAFAPDTPSGILRQMAAYLDAITQIYPARKISLAILWAETATLMPLPHDIVRAALH